MAFQLKHQLERLPFTTNPDLADMNVLVRKDVTLRTLFDMQIGLATGEPEPMQKACRQFGEEVLMTWDVTDEEWKDIPADGKGFQMLPIQLAIAVINEWVEFASTAGEGPGPAQNGSSPLAAGLIGTEDQ